MLFMHWVYYIRVLNIFIFAGLPAQHTTLAPATAAYYAATGESNLSGATSPTKYQENGQKLQNCCHF